MSKPKIEADKIISDGDIHYREYTTSELTWMLREAGFAVEVVRYMPMGSSKSQSKVKRLLKLVASGALTNRLLGSTHYVVATAAASRS